MPIAPFPVTRLVGIVGGSGFLGTATTEAFAGAGWRVVAIGRTPANARHLKPMGDLGQIAARFGDVRRPETLAPALRGVEAVINLAGILDEKAGQKFAAVHVEGARAVAAAARAVGARALVHVSAIGADDAGKSPYQRSKAAGEAAVREQFPDAIIVRPAIVFGTDDQFTNRFARLVAATPVVPVIAPETKVQPVFVEDIAAALLRLVESRLAGDRPATYELGGPETLTIRQVIELVADLTGRPRPLIDTPHLGARMLALFGFLPGAPITRNQLQMLLEDNVPSGACPGLAALGIDPVAIEAVASDWLRRYQPGGRFAAER